MRLIVGHQLLACGVAISLALLSGCSEPGRLVGSLADGVSAADSARLGAARARARAAVVSGSINPWFTWTASPADYQSAFPGREQFEPVTITFSAPAATVTIVGDGAISCTGTYGTLIGYDANDVERSRADMALIDPADCGEDDITFGARATVSSPWGIARVEILPMTPMTFDVSGRQGYATAYYFITAQELMIAPVAECTPSAPLRGQPIECSVSFPAGPEFEVLVRVARGNSFEVLETVGESVPANDTYRWGGTGSVAVARTNVTFRIRYVINGRTYVDAVRTSFDVQPRQWSQLTLTAPPLHVKATETMLSEYPTILPNGRAEAIGSFAFEDPDFSLLGTITRVAEGPNKDLSYYNQPPAFSGFSKVWTHPGLYNNTVPGGKVWRQDQNGVGSGTCLIGVLGSLARMTERHEGVTAHPSNSHWGIAGRELRRSGLHRRWERLFEVPGGVPLYDLAEAEFRTWKSGAHQIAQDAFDAVDGPAIFQSLGCSLDWMPPPGDP